MLRLIPAVFLALTAAPGWAQTPPAKPARLTPDQRFETANTSHDGHLTKEQAVSAKLTRVVRNFDLIDKDHKGFVTLDDMHAFSASQRAQHQAAKAPPSKG